MTIRRAIRDLFYAFKIKRRVMKRFLIFESLRKIRAKDNEVVRVWRKPRDSHRNRGYAITEM